MLGEKYFFHPTSAKAILGDFNEGVRARLLVFMDEIVWGGDKERAGVFKKIVSEKQITVNEKFKSLVKLDNIMNLIVASNESWVIPAGTTDTRWLCLSLDNKLATCSKNEKRKVVDGILKTDIKRLAKFFLLRDISNWDSDDIIITDELREQRILSMDKISKWWYTGLSDGYFKVKDYNTNNIKDNIRDGIFDLTGRTDLSDASDKHRIERSKLFDSYIEYSKDSHMINRSFYKKIREFCKDIVDTRPCINGKRIRCFNFPNIDILQDSWRTRYNDPNWHFDESLSDGGESDSDLEY